MWLDTETLQRLKNQLKLLLKHYSPSFKSRSSGYGRASSADQKGKMIPRSSLQSVHVLTATCQATGLVTLSARSDAKPGQGLGSKNKPVKQVKITEALNTEASWKMEAMKS